MNPETWRAEYAVIERDSAGEWSEPVFWADTPEEARLAVSLGHDADASRIVRRLVTEPEVVE